MMLFKDRNKKKEYCEMLGLTENELDFYLTLLKLGNTSVQKVARELGIFRSSAYVIMESLLKKGVISQEFKKQGRKLIPEPPKVLLRLIDEQKKKVDKVKIEIEDKIPDLLGIYEKALKDPIFKIYEGAEGLKAIHEDIIETGQTLYCYPSLDVAMNILPLEFQLDFVNKRIKKGIAVKAIFTREGGIDEMLKAGKEQFGDKDVLREARILIDPVNQILTGEKMFYGNKMVYMTYGKKITGVVIEHEEIVALEKKHFNLLWRAATPIKL